MARQPGTEPFSRTSDGWRRLTEMWEEGTANADMPPRAIYAADNIFLRYNKDQFRAGLNRFKAERGAYVRRQPVATEVTAGTGIDPNAQRTINAGIAQLQNVPTVAAAPPVAAAAAASTNQVNAPVVKKAAPVVASAVSTAVVKKDPFEDSKPAAVVTPSLQKGQLLPNSFNVYIPSDELQANQPKWEPIFNKCTFKDDELRNRQGIVVLLPSGVTEPEHVTAKVDPDGNFIIIRVLVPTLLCDPDLFLMFSDLPEYKNTMKDAHLLRTNGFHEAMKKERSSIGYQQWREFRLQTDYTVQEDIYIRHFLTLGTSYYIYLELRGKEKDSYLDHNGRLNVKVTDLNSMAKLRGFI